MARGADAPGRAAWCRRSLALAFAVTALLPGARAARADIDLSGGWEICLSIVSLCLPMTVVQAGTSLSVTIDGSAVATGTIDPIGGAFSVASSNPGCVDIELDGVATPDGTSMSGTARLEQRVPPGVCAFVTTGFTASRVPCGNSAAPLAKPRLALGKYDGIAGNDRLAVSGSSCRRRPPRSSTRWRTGWRSRSESPRTRAR
jgi:hypothetical protein